MNQKRICYNDWEIPLPLKRDRDDRLFCGTLEEEAAIRSDILFMKNFNRESPLLPPVNQLHTCHPESPYKNFAHQGL